MKINFTYTRILLYFYTEKLVPVCCYVSDEDYISI